MSHDRNASPFPSRTRTGRRRLLSSGFLLAAMALGALLPGREAFGRSTPTIDQIARCLFADRVSAREVGRVILRAHPDVVERLSVDDAPRLSGVHRQDRHALAIWANRRIQQDFAQEQIVRVDGWVLSRTEAALCAAMGQAA